MKEIQGDHNRTAQRDRFPGRGGQRRPPGGSGRSSGRRFGGVRRRNRHSRQNQRYTRKECLQRPMDRRLAVVGLSSVRQRAMRNKVLRRQAGRDREEERFPFPDLHGRIQRVIRSHRTV